MEFQEPLVFLSRISNFLEKTVFSEASSPPMNLVQLRISFKNFLSDYKDENDDVKYLKMGREMVIYNRNVMHISIQDKNGSLVSNSFSYYKTEGLRVKDKKV